MKRLTIIGLLALFLASMCAEASACRFLFRRRARSRRACSRSYSYSCSSAAYVATQKSPAQKAAPELPPQK